MRGKSVVLKLAAVPITLGMLSFCAALKSEMALAEFLSESDPSYAVIAEVQKYACEHARTPRCAQPTQVCRSEKERSVDDLTFPFDGDEQKQQLRKKIPELCNEKATPYERAGLHGLLKMRFDEIFEIAKDLQIETPSNLAYGPITLEGINVEVQVESSAGAPLVFVNVDFMEFANSFARLVAETIPAGQNSDDVSMATVDVDENAAKQIISDRPDLRRGLIALIDRFLLRDPLTDRSVPTPIGRLAQLVYAGGIESFALAHELGHIVYKHPTSSFDFGDFIKSVGNMIKYSEPTIPLSLREIEADTFAIRILLGMRDRRAKLGDHAFFSALLHAAEFYFLTQNILDEANQLIEGKAAPDYDATLDPDAKLVALCAVRQDCRAGELTGLSETLRIGTTHPPHLFRAAVIRHVIRSLACTEPQMLCRLGDAINRNALLLWIMTVQEYVDAHEVKINLKIRANQSADLNNRGNAYKAKGELDRAIADYTDAIALNSTNDAAFNNRGNAYRAKGELDRAIADYTDAIAFNSTNDAAFNNRGNAYSAKGDVDRAVADYTDAIRLQPSKAAFNNRANVYFYAGSFLKARSDFEKASQLDPKDPYTALWLEIASKRSNLAGSLSQAVPQIDMMKWPAPIVRLFLGEMTSAEVLAAADAPDSKTKTGQVCEANFFIGELALQQGDASEAAQRFKVAAERCPKSFAEYHAASMELKRLLQ